MDDAPQVDEAKLLVAALELLRRSVADLKESFVANTQRPADPDQQPKQRRRKAGGLFSSAGPDTDWNIPRPSLFANAKPGTNWNIPASAGGGPPKSPEPSGYLEAGTVQLAALVKSILDEIRKSKASRTATGAASRAKKWVGGQVNRQREAGRRLANSAPGKRIRRDFGNIRGLFGKAKNTRVGRAASSAASAGGRGLAGIIGKLAGPMAVLAGLMALLSLAISSNLSGFQLVGSAMRLMAATIAPVVLPFFLLLAAGLVELSDRIWKDVIPSLDGVYKFVFGSLLPALAAFLGGLQSVIDWLGNSWVARQIGLGPSDGGGGGAAGGAAAGDTGAGDWTGGSGAGGSFDDRPPTPGERASRAARPQGGDRRPGEAGAAAAGTARGEGGPGVTPQSRTAIQDVIREFKVSLAPKASFSSLTDVGRNVQLAGLNQSPLEQRLFDKIGVVVGKLDDISGKLDRPAEPNYQGRRSP